MTEPSKEAMESARVYPRMTWAASHKHTCNLCHIDKTPADGCDCGAELIDLIRSEMMSDEYPISEWEVQFAEKIKALPMFAQPATALQSARAEIERLRAALERIKAWEMPQTGRTRPDGTPMSYGWCFGSNGERDYVRAIARQALEPINGR